MLFLAILLLNECDRFIETNLPSEYEATVHLRRKVHRGCCNQRYLLREMIRAPRNLREGLCLVLRQGQNACASYKFDRIEILDFSRFGLKHQPHGYVGHFATRMAEIVLPAAA